MPLKIRRKVAKKATRKMVRKPATKSNSSLVKLIKKITLKPVETKNTHNIEENQQLFHNVPSISFAHLYTTQGFQENDTGLSSFQMRLGDEIILRGLSYKFWFANKFDRPSVMYKIVFFKYQSNTNPTSPAPYYSQGTSNYMIRDLDTEKYKIIKVVNFNLSTSAQRILPGENFEGAEGHKKISVWIPLKNVKCKYENSTNTPRFMDYGFTIVCYDSYGTLITDNIASYAVNRKLYFKDP